MLVALGGAAGAGVAAASGTPRTSSVSAPRQLVAVALPKVLDCGGKVVFEPGQYVLACADYNAYFTALRWTAWTARSATAVGVYSQNDCTPDCAAGHFWSAPGTITLTTPRPTKLGVLFTSARYSYTRSFVTSLPTKPLG
jgi:hypothetical protein